MDFLSQADAIRIETDAYHSSDNKLAKIINCPVHGHMRIPGIVLEFVDTPQFQYVFFFFFPLRFTF